MRHLSNLIIILIISILLSFFGWFVDSDPKGNDVLFNIFEIFMLSLFIFLLISPFYFIIKFIKNKFNSRIKNK